MQKTARETGAMKLWIDFFTLLFILSAYLFILVCFVSLSFTIKICKGKSSIFSFICKALMRNYVNIDILMRTALLLVNLLGLHLGLEDFHIIKNKTIKYICFDIRL